MLASQGLIFNSEHQLPLSAHCQDLQATHKGQRFYVHGNPVPAKDRIRHQIISVLFPMKYFLNAMNRKRTTKNTPFHKLAPHLSKLPQKSMLARFQKGQSRPRKSFHWRSEKINKGSEGVRSLSKLSSIKVSCVRGRPPGSGLKFQLF